MRHFPFRIGTAERDRWMTLMTAAMEEVDVPSACREELTIFLAQTADFLRNVEEEP